MISDISTLFDAEESAEFQSPLSILTVDGGALLFDGGAHQFVKMSDDWTRLFTFGEEGRGPGEFQQVNRVWENEEGFLIYDRPNAKFVQFDRQGRWIDDRTFDHSSFNLDFLLSPASIGLIEPNLLAISTDGYNGSLAVLLDSISGSTTYLGEASGDYVTSIAHDRPKMIRDVQSGIIPGHLQNSVILKSNQSGLFLYQTTTAILEKYSHSGELLWTENVLFPFQEDLMDHMFAVNSDRLNRGLFMSHNYLFNYVVSMTTTEEGVAFQLNLTDENAVAVAWISNDGEDISIVHYEGMEHRPTQIAVQSDVKDPYILFLNLFEGQIYRAAWPL
ncbi:MAG: hypothetical protein WEA36_06995 [Balneolaceae bacterium]